MCPEGSLTNGVLDTKTEPTNEKDKRKKEHRGLWCVCLTPLAVWRGDGNNGTPNFSCERQVRKKNQGTASGTIFENNDESESPSTHSICNMQCGGFGAKMRSEQYVRKQIKKKNFVTKASMLRRMNREKKKKKLHQKGGKEKAPEG